MFHTNFDAKNKLWSGSKIAPFYNPQISVGHAVLKAMKLNPKKTAQVSDNNSVHVTYEEMYDKTIRAAQNIQKLNYRKGDLIGIVAKNSHHLAPIVFASFCIGCPINTLDPSFNEPEMIHMLSITKPKLIFCDVETYDLVAKCLRQLNNEAKIFTFNGTNGSSQSVEDLFIETGEESDFLPTEIDGLNEIAAIICSSGTTGLSKGVCLSHAALLDSMTRFQSLTGDDVLFCFSSLYWLSGLIVLLNGTLNTCTRLITTDAYSPELLLRLLEKYKVTFAFSATHQLILSLKNQAINHTDLSNLKYFMVGGSKVPLGICIEMNKYLSNGEVNVGYGMSEIGGVISLNLPFTESETVGKLVSGIQIKIINVDGNLCNPSEVGEICIKTSYKFLGYYGNKKSTDETIDNDGFLLTGDIGYFDENGFLFLVDRKKDFLRYRGFMISPSEIEDYLINCSQIKSVCVVGISDPISNDLPAAVIVRNENSKISEQDVSNMIADYFSDCKKLRGGVYFVDSLPTTPSGKIVRRQIKVIATDLYNKNS